MYLGNSGGNWGPDTLLERLSSQPDFNGPVIHVVVNRREPAEGMQRPYVVYESVIQSTGEFAYEASYLMARAPRNLQDSGWHGDPIVILHSLLTHIDQTAEGKYRLYGGVRLYYRPAAGKYYVRVYTGNQPGNGPATTDVEGNLVEFQIGVKQGVRTEIFYHNGLPTIRSFLVVYSKDGTRSYILIGQGPITDATLKETPIRGTIVYEGIYASNSVQGLEAFVGEGMIYR